MNLKDVGKLKQSLEVPTRWVVAFITFVGFIFNFALRTSMNIAIVAMVNFTAVRENAKLHLDHGNLSKIGSFAQLPNSSSVLERCDSGAGPASSSMLSAVKNESLSSTMINAKKEGTFVWDETAQGAILGSFYWGYILTQLLGGRLSERFGPKLVLLASLGSAAIVTMLIPSVANWGLGWVITLRIIQGICEGPTYPTMNVIVSRWAVPHERSRMLSVVYLGGTFGGLLALWVGGMVIPSLGYASIFYITGLGCLLWVGAFWMLAYDSPSEHPRISKKELEMYPAHETAAMKVKDVPWKQILSCRGVWAVVLCSFTKGCSMSVTIMMPIYLKAVLSFDVKSSGTYSALPYIGRIAFPVLISCFVDWIISKRRFSTTNIRKTASTIDYVGNGVCLLIVSLVGCDYVSVIALLSLAAALGGAAYSGYTGCLVEMSPTYSGTVGGLSSMGFSLGSLLSPLISGAILQGKQNLQQWAIVFQLAAAVNLIMGCLFWLLGTSERQSFDPVQPAPETRQPDGCPESGDQKETKDDLTPKGHVLPEDAANGQNASWPSKEGKIPDTHHQNGVLNQSFVPEEEEVARPTKKPDDDVHETRLI